MVQSYHLSFDIYAIEYIEYRIPKYQFRRMSSIMFLAVELGRLGYTGDSLKG